MPASGHIAKAMFDAGKAWDEANAASAHGVKISVNQHNIVKAAAIIQAEADRFGDEMRSIAADLRVQAMGGDPVSEEAARVLNFKFRDAKDSYVRRCSERAEMLQRLADQLREAAKTYQLTEEQITTQFEQALHDAKTADDPPRRGAGGMRDI